MSGRTQGVHGGQASSLEARYDRALRDLIPRYMDRHRLSRSGLAEALGVNRSTLSRFLNRVEGYTPAPGRPEIIRILEQVEAVCLRQNMHGKMLNPNDWANRAGATDTDIWFGNFQHRLNYLEEELDPVTALVLLPELCAQAESAPPPYSASMCVNLLLRIGFLVDRAEMSDASRDLLLRTTDRVRRLADRLDELTLRSNPQNVLDKPLGKALHRPPGYAGYCLAWLGLHLADDDLTDEGLSLLEVAVGMDHEPTDYHWPNLLTLLQAAAERAHPRAPDWAVRAYRMVQIPLSEELAIALRTRDYPDVVAKWTEVYPDFQCPRGDA